MLVMLLCLGTFLYVLAAFKSAPQGTVTEEHSGWAEEAELMGDSATAVIWSPPKLRCLQEGGEKRLAMIFIWRQMR